MSGAKEFNLTCPMPLSDQAEIMLSHGGGGAMTHQLIERIILPTFNNPLLNAQHDGAILQFGKEQLAFTTDSYVVNPYKFPGGDIGMLAVNGTVNDLAMCGALPSYLSVGLILEEGFPMDDLRYIVSSMQKAAKHAGVSLVTGDTKVVDKGSGDGIFINTSGVGVLQVSVSPNPRNVCPGDAILLSGDIGRHGMAVMSAREALEFETQICSDTCALASAVQALYAAGVTVHCLRDPTRGGIATSLVEIAETAGVAINIDEAAVTVTDEVRGACEILGFDPLYVANEGCFLAFVPEAEKDLALATLRQQTQCAQASIIGSVGIGNPGLVTSKTVIGGERVIDMLSGEQLPRIC